MAGKQSICIHMKQAVLQIRVATIPMLLIMVEEVPAIKSSEIRDINDGSYYNIVI